MDDLETTERKRAYGLLTVGNIYTYTPEGGVFSGPIVRKFWSRPENGLLSANITIRDQGTHYLTSGEIYTLEEAMEYMNIQETYYDNTIQLPESRRQQVIEKYWEAVDGKYTARCVFEGDRKN